MTPRTPSKDAWRTTFERAQAGAASWRGVASEQQDDLSKLDNARMHRRTRALLLSLVAPYRARIALGTVLIMGNTAADLLSPLLIGAGIDHALDAFESGSGYPRDLSMLIWWLGGLALIQAGTNVGFIWIVGRATQDVLRDLRMRVFARFQKLSLSFYERYTSGRVIARMTSDVDAVSDLLAVGLNDLAVAGLSVVGIAVVLLVQDPPLALATLATFPGVVIATRLYRRHAHRVYRTVRRTVALVIIHFVESLGGIRAVQAFRREGRNQEIMEDVNAQYCAANVESIRLLSIYSPSLSMIGRLAMAVVVLYGGSRVLGGHLTVGLLFTFIILVRRFFEPMQELSQVYNLLQSANAALDNLAGILDEDPSVPEPIRPAVPERPEGRLRFERVTFAYRDVDVLRDLTLEIPAGQTVALVGETGAGKTTIARLAARFWDPSDGRVLMDGVDLRDVPDAELRRLVAMVTQESFLFGGTVADNIALGRPDATREDVEDAARAIGAHGFIAALPHGYDTDVRKRGGRLSAGQRQLVSFARAFLADPRVLILDEATSSLDIPSERLVQHALRTLLADRTAIIIAHRLSTVEIADRVLVVDAGRIVEDGPPSELTAGAGAYAALHEAWRESLA
ncbi:MAG TPA: ABC transporter ATP-binding protein [Actinomycetota bacterium]